MSLLSLPFGRDAEAKSVTTWHEDDATDEIVVEEEHDVTDVVEAALASYNNYDARARWHDINRVALIPMVIYWKLYTDGVIEDPKRLKAWLNDRDNLAFRTRPGRI